MPTGCLYCIVGPSGSGKTTLMKDLKKLGFREAISHTTRACRGPEDSDSYHFVSRNRFLWLLEHGALVSPVLYANNYYGVSLEELDQSDFVIVEPSGAKNLQEEYAKRPVRIIGLTATNETLAQRLRARAADGLGRTSIDLDVFKDLHFISDLVISSVTPEATLFSVIQYLRFNGEKLEAPLA